MSNNKQLRIEGFLSELIAAQDNRECMPLSFDGLKPAPYWNTYEMLVVWKRVNQLRDAYDKEMLPFSEIKRVEQLASGHVDYTRKFALYASELVDKD